MADTELMTQDDFGLFGALPPPWGIYLNNNIVVEPDTFLSFGYGREWDLSTYPLEKGAFETFNKVETPFRTLIRMAAGGALANRQAFLASVDAIAGTLELYDVVTPEKTYTSVNVQKLEVLNRTNSHGAAMLVVELRLLEIRVTGATTFASTKTPGGASAVNGGTVQTQAPDSAAAATFNDRFSAAGS